ncbi:AlpA family transcriptional regulator [Kluyvera cryocrescens]|nr:AlpA family transcriptional regulator [Kluyvera cryocrescens]MCX2868202.1 AlpA family transcriptional regulator [Kluyvera cryocrescens]
MRLINLSEVMHRTGFRKTAIYSWIKDGTFPLPVKIGSSVRWSLEEIEAWIQSKLDTRLTTGNME